MLCAEMLNFSLLVQNSHDKLFIFWEKAERIQTKDHEEKQFLRKMHAKRAFFFFKGIVIDQIASEKRSSVSNVVEDIICLSVYCLP